MQQVSLGSEKCKAQKNRGEKNGRGGVEEISSRSILGEFQTVIKFTLYTRILYTRILSTRILTSDV